MKAIVNKYNVYFILFDSSFIFVMLFSIPQRFPNTFHYFTPKVSRSIRLHDYKTNH